MLFNYLNDPSVAIIEWTVIFCIGVTLSWFVWAVIIVLCLSESVWVVVCVVFCNHEINEYTLTSESNIHRWWLIFIVPSSVCWPLWKATGKRESIPRAQLGHRQPHKSSTLILTDSPLLSNAPNWMLCILGLLHWDTCCQESEPPTTILSFFLSVILIRLTSKTLLFSSWCMVRCTHRCQGRNYVMKIIEKMK